MSTEKISLNDSLMDIVKKMSGGNPGALRVCAEMLAREHGLLRVLDMDDMGIRGSSIWLAYKDFAGEHLDVLEQALKSRDQALVNAVRAAGGQAWTGGRS